MSSLETRRRIKGFTLIELLVSMAVLAIIGIVMVSVTGAVQKISRQTKGRAEEFRESRRAFDRINQRLSQATLNTYFDYVDSNGNPRTSANAATFTPSRYARISELRYLQTNASAFAPPREGDMIGQAVFFQAPTAETMSDTLTGLNSLLNTVGYFIVKGSDQGLLPPTVTATKNRYRLYELVEPTENLTIYTNTSGNASYQGTNWCAVPLANSNFSHRLADNIVALVFQAIYPNTNGVWLTNVTYSSAPRGNATQSPEENNLPPRVKINMIAVDEVAAQRIVDANVSLTSAVNTNDLATLEQQLIDNRLNYRKFESVISIGPAKWSTQ